LYLSINKVKEERGVISKINDDGTFNILNIDGNEDVNVPASNIKLRRSGSKSLSEKKEES